MASIEKRADRRYVVRYRVDGRQRARSFARLVDARTFTAEVERAHHRGELVDPRRAKVTLAAWSERWLAEAVDLKPKTVAGYRSILDRHLLPRWGSTSLARISRPAVRTWVAELSADGHGAGTVKNIVNALKAALSAAVDAGILPTNPAAGVRLPRPERAEKFFLTADEVRALADAVDPRFRTLIYAAAYSGLRAGELAALRWDRVNLKRGTFEVVESYAEVHGALVLGPTKTYAQRTVRIPRFLCDMLAAEGVGEGLVFTDTDGGPLRQSNLYRRNFQPAAVKVGLGRYVEDPDGGRDRYEGPRFHDMRHTCAALLIAEGAHPLAVKERLGHSSITVTMDVYGGLFPSLEDHLTDRLDDVFRRAAN